MSLYFKNPPSGKKRRKGGRKKKRTAAQKRATAKLVAANKARKKAKTKTKKRKVKRVQSVKRKARRSTTKKGVRKMARRKSRKRGKRRSSGNITLKRISGKVYRSNPPVVKAVVQGIKDAAFVKAGGIAGTMVSDMVPVTGLGKTAVKAAVAVGLGMLPVPGDGRRFIVAGAMSGVLDDLLVMAGLGKLTGGSGVSAYLPSDGGVSAYLSGTDDAYVGESPESLGAYVNY